MGFKIVRDRHKEQMENIISGTWRTSPEPVSALIKKLGEEYGEFTENHDPRELYDLRDVLSELIILLDPSGNHFKSHWEKIRRYGMFTRHLEWCPMPEGWEG